MYDYDYDYDADCDRDYDYDGPDWPDPEPNEAAYEAALAEIAEEYVPSGLFASMFWRIVSENGFDGSEFDGNTTVEIIHEFIEQGWVNEWAEFYENRAYELASEDGESYDANYGDPCGCSDPHCPCSGSKVLNFRTWG